MTLFAYSHQIAQKETHAHNHLQTESTAKRQVTAKANTANILNAFIMSIVLVAVSGSGGE